MGRYSLNGQVALVTGAARGIGAATARALVARGASVALVDLEAPDAFDAERTLGLAADVIDREAVGNAVEATIARFGGLDVIVANAGIAPYVTTALAMDPDAFRAGRRGRPAGRLAHRPRRSAAGRAARRPRRRGGVCIRLRERRRCQ